MSDVAASIYMLGGFGGWAIDDAMASNPPYPALLGCRLETYNRLSQRDPADQERSHQVFVCVQGKALDPGVIC